MIHSELPKSDIYRECIPGFTAGRVRLVESARLTKQLLALERRTSRMGRDLIDHPPNSHDDLANAACGALQLVLARAVRTPVKIVKF